MKKIAMLLAALLVSSMAYAAAPIEGDWGMPYADNGFTFDLTISIHGNMLVMTNVCHFNGQTAQAQVSAPVTYTENTLTTFNGGHDVQNANGMNCEATITPDTMNYAIQGNMLFLSQPGNPQQMVLTRK